MLPELGCQSMIMGVAIYVTCVSRESLNGKACLPETNLNSLNDGNVSRISEGLLKDDKVERFAFCAFDAHADFRPFSDLSSVEYSPHEFDCV